MVDTICLDKTGVLTTRRMQVARVIFGDGTRASVLPRERLPFFEHIRIGCALCNDVGDAARVPLANPIDRALIEFARTSGIDVEKLDSRFNRIFEQAFDPELRAMACGLEEAGKRGETIHFVKGDPGILLPRCAHYVTSQGVRREVDRRFRVAIQRDLAVIGKGGDVAIALAESSQEFDPAGPKLTFLALFHIQNPIRAGAKEVVEGLLGRGLRCVLLTGDREAAAGEVAVACGISGSSRMVLSGGTMDKMALDGVAEQTEVCSVFARMMPSQKATLIRLLQRQGHLVAMVGDGPNDPLALRAANVGITFMEESSALARGNPRILIRNLEDLGGLAESACRLLRRQRKLTKVRRLGTAGLIGSVYLAALLRHFVVR